MKNKYYKPENISC